VGGALAESVVDAFVAKLTDPDFLLSLFTGGGKAKFEELAAQYGLTGRVAIQRIRDMVVAALNVKFGNPGELDGVGNLFSTSAISGVGASNVGIAGSAAIAIINGETAATIAGKAVLPADADIVVDGVVTISAEAAQKIYTTASASADKNGMAQKNKDGKGDSGGKSVGVGASAAISTVDMRCEAILGERRFVEADALTVLSELRSDIDAVSVAGSDPIARRDNVAVTTPQIGGVSTLPQNNTSHKDISVDASVALSMIDNIVHAFVGSGAKLALDGGNIIETKTELSPGALERVNLWLRAYQRGQTSAASSGFAIGGQAAVGAAIAINLENSDVKASFLGSAVVKGIAKVEAKTLNEDEAIALATVVGASLDRYLAKMRSLFRMLSLNETLPTGGLNASIVAKLNKFAGPAMQTGGSAISGLPLLPTLMQRLNINLPTNPAGSGSAGGAIGKAGENANGATGQQTNQDGQNGQKINIAAAAAVNVTEHIATAEVAGTISCEELEVTAENRANYRTVGTGAAVTPMESNSNNISIGVAVSVNDNEANALVSGDLTAKGNEATPKDDGRVRITSTLTQNMDGKYLGLLGAQGIAGSVAGSGGKVGFAGAVAILVAKARANATIAADAIIRGGDVSVGAVDKSKLAVRAGAVTIGGAQAGIGASFALIYAENSLIASVGSRARVTAKSLKVTAQKQPVDASDYKFPFGWDALFTVNVEEASRKGLININTKEKTGGIIGVDVAIGADDLLKVIDTLNYLASVSYYAEAIAGAIAAGQDAKVAIAGSVAMLFTQSRTEASIGDHALIALDGGDAEVSAASKTNARIIGGAIGATKGKVGAGVNIASVSDRDEIFASIGDDSAISGAKDVLVGAKADRDLLAVTIAAGATGESGGAALGGGINVIVTGSDVRADVGKRVHVAASGIFAAQAENLSDLTLISTSLAFSTNGAALGGTVAVIVAENNTQATVGDYAEITAGGDVLVKAVSDEKLLNVLASLSGSAGDPLTVAGTIGVLVSQSETRAEVGSRAKLRATAGSVSILADGEVKQVVVLAAVTGGTGKAAVGATVNVNVFEHKVLALVGEHAELIADAVEAGRNVVILATAGDQTIIVTVAGGMTSGNVGIAGAIPVIVSQSSVRAGLGGFAKAYAGDSVVIYAELITGLYDVAGGIAIGSTAGVGITASTAVLNNTVEALVGDSAQLIAHAAASSEHGLSAGVQLPNRTDRRRGVIVRASAENRILLASMSGGGAGTAGVSGVVNTLVDKNTVRAVVGNSVKIISGYEETEGGEAGDETGADAEVAVEAEDDSELYNLAGAVAVGGTAGVGGTIVVMVYDKVLEALIGGLGSVRATGDVSASAASEDTVLLLALSFGGGGTAAVSVGASALVFQNRVTAGLGGAIRAGGDISIGAIGRNDIFNIAAAFAGAGTAAVTPVGVVTYCEGKTKAVVGAGADFEAAGKFTLTADSKEFITADAAGVAGSGTAAVSGTVDILISKQTTEALTEANARITAGAITVRAEDGLDAFMVVGTVAVSGEAAVGVTAIVSVLRNTTTAGFGAGSRIKSLTGDIAIAAKSDRNVGAYAATAGVGGGAAGVAATIMVTVVGGKLTKDTSDALSKGFNSESFMSTAFGAGHASAGGYRQNTAAGTGRALEGDGVKLSDAKVGKDGKFDGESGYRSGDLDSDEKGDAGERGGDQEIDETKNEDISAAGNLGAAKPDYDPMDSIGAYIGAGATVDSKRDIKITACDNLIADMFTGTVAGGFYAGVGIGVAVGVLYSNVLAYVEDGAALSAGGDIEVSARAGSTPVPDGEAGRADDLKNVFTGDSSVNLTDRTIRAISVTGSAGIAGVSGAVAAIAVHSNVFAYIEGDVTRADNLTVKAVSEYPLCLAATLAVSGGIVGVGASVAIVLVSGNSKASIAGDASVAVGGKVSVRTVLNMSALTGAAAFAAGGVGVNGAVSLAVNRTRADTFVGQGVRLGAAELLVDADVDSHAKAYILGVALGGGLAANLSAGIAIVAPTVLTYIGETPGDREDADGAAIGSKGQVTAPKVIVKNDVTSTARTSILTLSASALGISGNVLLVFNRTDAVAGIAGANVDAATSILIDAFMHSTAESKLAAAAAGSVTIGFSVSYVHLRSSNQALIDTTGAAVSAPIIGVYAGRSDNRNTASAAAHAVTGNVGMMTFGLNAAIADNDARNLANIVGNGFLTASTMLDLCAYGKATAEAEIHGIDFSGIKIVASFAAAVLRSRQEAVLYGSHVTAGGVAAKSYLSSEEASANAASAKLNIGCGILALVSAPVNVAIAYGRSASIAGIAPNSIAITGGKVDIRSDGHANALAEVKNQSNVNLLAAGLNAAFAYQQARFDAYLVIPNDESVETEGTVGDVDVKVSYTSRAKAELTPSEGGVEFSYYANIKVNVAVAGNSTAANAYIAGAGAIAANKVTVSAIGEAYADATVYKPIVSGGMANVAANAMAALLSATQKAYIQSITIRGTSASVTSELNKDKGKGASATLGSNGGNASASLAGVNSKANIAVAIADATGSAKVISANLILTGALTVNSKGDSYAKAVVNGDDFTGGAVGIGVNELYAYAKGGFNATAGGNISASSITIDSNYKVNANAVSAQPNGGAKLELATIQGNIAYAETDASSTAGIDGAGTIATGALSATANATAKATAEIQGVNLSITGVNLAVNVVTAVVNGTQKAIVRGATVSASSVSVRSYFNIGSSTENYAATAVVGSNGGASVGIVGGNTSSAKASVTAKVSSEVDGAVFASVPGAVTVLTEAKSFALARVIEPTAAVTLVNVSLIKVEADAAGTFTASFKVGPGDSSVGSVSVKSVYTVYSRAKTGSAGGLNLSLANAKLNKATANTSVAGNAGFGSGGKLEVSGDVLVMVDAIADAIADVASPSLSVSGYGAAVNEVTANLNASQNAYAFGSGSANIAGQIEILSKLNASEGGHGALAISRGPRGSISALAAYTNSAYANSASENIGYIADIDLTAASVKLYVHTVNLADARAENGSALGAFAYGNLYAESCTADRAVAKISGGKVTATSGSVDLDAENSSTSKSLAAAGGTDLLLVGATTSESKAYVGKSGRRQVAEVFIADGAVVKAKEDVDLYAYNIGLAQAIIQKGGSYSIAKIAVSALPTVSYYSTYAGVKDGCRVAADRDIRIRAQDYARARSEAMDTSMGVGVNVATTYGDNAVYTDTKVEIGAAKLFSTRDVLIQAESSAYMYALTYASVGSIFYGSGTMQARNYLARTVTADILGGADIESDFGTLTVRATGGAADEITTYARCDSTGFVAIGDARAYIDVSTVVKANVARGAKLKNTFGYVKIYTDASMNRAYAYAHVYNSGVGNEPDAKALGTLTLTSQVNLGGSAGSGTAEAVGKNVDIRSYLGKLNFTMQSYSRGRGLGVNVDSESRTYAYLTSEVNARNATVKGYDSVVIQAESRPGWRSAHILNDAYSFAQGIGDATATAQLGGSYSKTSVHLYGGTNVYGAKVTIDALRFNGTVNQYPHTRRTGIASSHTNHWGSFSNQREMYVDSGVGFHIGDAAAGIVIDISASGVRQVGLPKENMSLVGISGDVVTINPLSNPLPGFLYLGVHDGSGYKVYNQQFIPEVIIINRTGMRLDIMGITVENINFVYPSVSGGNGIKRESSLNRTPTIIIESRSNGGVYVRRLISNRTGTTIFRWTGRDGGNLTSDGEVPVASAAGAKVSPVWTHSLIIENAANIGADADNRFTAFLFLLGTEEGAFSAVTSGSSYMRLTPVLFIEKNTKDEVTDAADASAFSPTLRVERLMATGDNDLVLANGIRLYSLKGSTVIEMPLPGTLEYVTGELKGLTASATISTAGLERYLQGYSIADDVYIYLLPNGTTIYVDSLGQIARVTEMVGATEVSTTLKDFAFVPGDSGIAQVGLGTGVSLNLGTGELTLESGANFEALLSVIDADWLMNNTGTGAGKKFVFTYTQRKLVTDPETGGSIWETELIEVGVTPWITVGTSILYWVNNRGLSSTNLLDENEMYLLRKTGDTLEVFVIGGPDEVNEQHGYNKDSLYPYYDDKNKTVTVDDGIANKWKNATPAEFNEAKEQIGNLVLDFENPKLEVQYVGIGNFLGIDRLWAYYEISTGLWYYREAYEYFPGLYTSRMKLLPDQNIGTAHCLLSGTVLQNVYYGGSPIAISVQNDYFYTQTIRDEWDDNGGYIAIDNGGNYRLSMSGPMLREWDITVLYATKRAASLAITPVDPEDEDTRYHVGVFETDEPGNANSYAEFDGPIKNIPIKEDNLPANSYESGTGYRIHDMLYIAKNGQVLMLVDSDGDRTIDFSAAYNGATYRSDFMTIANVGALLNAYTGANEPIQPQIELKKDVQSVALERLTNFVATDVQGRYWYWDGAVWNLATAVPVDGKTRIQYGGNTHLTIWTKDDVLYFLLPDDTQIGSDGSIAGGGTTAQAQKLISVDGLKYLLGMLEGDNVVVTMPDAHGSLEDGRRNGQVGPNIHAFGDATFISSSTGSIGTAVAPLGIVVGGELIFKNLAGETKLETNANLISNEGDVVIAPGTVVRDVLFKVSANGGSIRFTDITVLSEDDGDSNNGALDFRALEEIAQLAAPVPGHLTGLVLRGAPISKAYADWTASNGGISLARIDAINAKVELDAGGSISAAAILADKKSELTLAADGDIVSTSVTLTDSKLIGGAGGTIMMTTVRATEGSEVSLTAVQHIMASSVSANDSKVTGSAGGSITVTLAIDAAADSEVTLTADGGISIASISADGGSTVEGHADMSISAQAVDARAGSTVKMEAKGDIDSAAVFADDSDILFDSGADISVGRIDADNKSLLDFDADGSITAYEADLNGSTLDFLAGRDILFDIIEGDSSTVALRSRDGNIFTKDAGSYIRLRGASALTLSAGGDIGRSGARLIADVPENIIVRIEKVANLHLDGVALTGGAFDGARPSADIRSGRAEGGKALSGDWLGAAGIEALNPAIANQTPEQIAAWIASLMARSRWESMITADALSSQIGLNAIAPNTLKALLVDGVTFTDAALNQMLLAKDYATLGTMLSAVLPATQPDPITGLPVPRVADEVALKWLEGAIADDKVADLAGTLSALLTQDEILALIEAAWVIADYAGHSVPAMDDPAARALNLSIGTSTGAAHIWNEGDIAIVQDHGDFTAADVRSERGDADIRASEGSIFGAESDAPNVQARRIKLFAALGIGSGGRALTTEQQANRPTLVANITKPVKDAGGDYALRLFERPVTETVLEQELDLNGDPMYDLFGEPVMHEVERPVLDALGHPVTEWVADIAVAYDWLRVDYPAEATRLDAKAGGSVYLAEASGDFGLGTIEAGGDVSLCAPGTIYDVRGDSETAPNIEAVGKASLTSDNGTIGTNGDYLETDVGGVVTARAEGDINILDRADLALVADSAHGQVNADAAGDIELSNSDPNANLIIGPVHAGGNASIAAQGSLVAGDRLGRSEQVVGASIRLEAGGDIGTPESPILIETDAEAGGTLTALASGCAYATELTGGLIVKKIATGGDAVLAVPGGVTDEDGGQKVVNVNDKARDFIEATARAEQAQAAADAAKAYAADGGRLPEELGRAAAERAVLQAQALLDAQQASLAALNSQLDALKLNPKATPKQIDALARRVAAQQAKVDAAQLERIARQSALDGINARIDLARQHAEDLQGAADLLRLDAQALANQAHLALFDAMGAGDSIEAGGSVTIAAGGPIGSSANALGVRAAGTVSLSVGDPANDTVDIEGTGGMNLLPIRAGSVYISAIGSILAAGAKGGDIAANSLSIRSVTGDVGAANRPIRTSVANLTAMGNNICIENDRSLTLDGVIGGTVDLAVRGNVISGSGTPNIFADLLKLRASGNIAAIGDRLDIHVGALDMAGRDAFLHNSSGYLDVLNIQGKYVDIEADGFVIGGTIFAKNLRIFAQGGVGSAGDPLAINVPGRVNIASAYGRVYWKNLFRPEHYIPRTLTDPRTGVSVIGDIHRRAVLSVANLTLLDREALAARIRQALLSEALVLAYGIRLTAPGGEPGFVGTVEVRIPVDPRYEGLPLLVLGFVNGRYALFGGIVKDGVLAFETAELGDFVVLDPALYEEVFKLFNGFLNWTLSEQMDASEEALAILEAAYRAYREQSGEGLYLLNASTGVQADFEKDGSAPEGAYEGMRLEVEIERPDGAEGTAAQSLPVSANLRAVKTDETGAEQAVQLPGPVELTLRLYGQPLTDVSVACRMPDGTTEVVHARTGPNGELVLSLAELPERIEISKEIA